MNPIIEKIVHNTFQVLSVLNYYIYIDTTGGKATIPCLLLVLHRYIIVYTIEINLVRTDKSNN